MNKRIISIAELLLSKNEYITVNTISEALKVSNKTIRNDLVILEEWIKEFDLILDKKTGAGVAIRGSEQLKLKVLGDLSNKSNYIEAYSPEDRRNLILKRLFTTNSKIRIHELSKELHVSRATIHKDLVSVEEWLEEFNITLIRKTNHGLEISCKEKDLRKAMSSLICLNKNYLEMKELLYLSDAPFTSITESSSLKMIKGIMDIDFLKLQSIVLDTKELSIYGFSDESLISLLIHIGISIKRIKEGNSVVLSDALLESLKCKDDFIIAKKLCDKIQSEFHIDFPDNEIGYLLLHILGSKTYNYKNISDMNDIDNENASTALLLSREMIKYWEWLLNLPLTQDNQLLSSLVIHLKPAIHRLDFGMPINNPILDDIKNTYPYTFKAAKESIFIIEDYLNCSVNEDEIGYLALHLASAIDRSKQPLKTIIVCHSGVGASQLLANKLKNEFNQLEIISSISCSGLTNINLDEIDLIITTAPLELDCPSKVIAITPLLRKHDIFRLNSLIKKIYSEKNSLSMKQ